MKRKIQNLKEENLGLEKNFTEKNLNFSLEREKLNSELEKIRKIEKENQEIIHGKNQEIQDLISEKEKEIQDKEKEIQEKEYLNEKLGIQIGENLELIAKIKELEHKDNNDKLEINSINSIKKQLLKEKEVRINLEKNLQDKILQEKEINSKQDSEYTCKLQGLENDLLKEKEYKKILYLEMETVKENYKSEIINLKNQINSLQDDLQQEHDSNNDLFIKVNGLSEIHHVQIRDFQIKIQNLTEKLTEEEKSRQELEQMLKEEFLKFEELNNHQISLKNVVLEEKKFLSSQFALEKDDLIKENRKLKDTNESLLLNMEIHNKLPVKKVYKIF